jgi:hypothetical protein
MAKIYVGDIGTITISPPKIGLPKDLDLSGLSFRQLCNLAVVCGFDVRDLIGIDNCYEHVEMVLIFDRALPEGFNLFDHCSYCRNCWRMFRVRYKEDGINENENEEV